MSDDQVINVGIIGVGFMGATHLAAYQRAARDGFPCRLVALCDPKPHRRAGDFSDIVGNLASGSGAAAFDPRQVRAYESAGDLIADPAVSLVSVSTHADTHVELAERAMRAGKHVLIEKPVALTAEPVQKLAAVANECGVVAMPAMCMRFWPAWSWLKDAADKGRFGEMRNCRFTRLGTRPTWSAAYLDDARTGGALVDLHMHDIDFVIYLLGEPAGISAAGTINHLTTLLRYAQVPHVAAEGGWDQHAGFGFTMRYLANFERATLDFDIARAPQLLLCRDGWAEAVELPPLTGYDCEIRHLVECLATGRRPAVSLSDAVTTHQVLDAIREQIRDGNAA